MIYCCVKVAYVLLKVTLVNDRACVLNNLMAPGAAISHPQPGERHSEPGGPAASLRSAHTRLLPLHAREGLRVDANRSKSF